MSSSAVRHTSAHNTVSCTHGPASFQRTRHPAEERIAVQSQDSYRSENDEGGGEECERGDEANDHLVKAASQSSLALGLPQDATWGPDY